MTDVSLRLLVLKTHDVAGVCAFYGSLGLTFIEEQHGKGPRHYSAPLGDGIIEIYPLPDDQAVDSTTRLGFAIADPDAAVESAASLGGHAIKPGRDTSWGYGFGRRSRWTYSRTLPCLTTPVRANVHELR